MKYRVSVKQGKGGLCRWQIVDKETGKAVALAQVNDTYPTRGDAMRAGLEFVKGMQRPRGCDRYLVACVLFGAIVGAVLCRLFVGG